MDRRSFLRRSGAFTGLSAIGLTGCAHRTPAPAVAAAPTLPFYNPLGPIVPIRATVDRIFRITVCLRPFRPAGPRLEVERLGDKLVVHNYGHGGSGWSLSWGSADFAVRQALTALDGRRDIAVIGCGALGLTAALTAQRAGLRVTIYARERPPFVRSARATGSWTPGSRVALASAASPDFASQWEAMARTSFAMYQSYLGLSGSPIEWTERYTLQDLTGAPPRSRRQRNPDAPVFGEYESRLADITPRNQDLPAGSHPFPAKSVQRTTSLTFNVASYSRQLLNEFLIAGGAIETREFHTPQDLAALPQQTLINCTGYGARQLWSDESLVPIRGQIAWLVPQEGVNYGLYFNSLFVLARRDGIVVQPLGESNGWNDSNEQPNRADAEAGVLQLQDLYNRMANQQRRS